MTGPSAAVLTGTFRQTGSMATPRVAQTDTLLADGHVLVAGGSPDGATPLASAELYDPATGTFNPTGSMAQARYSAAAARLLDGRVLIAGGNGLMAGQLATAELYNPATGKFGPAGSMATALEDATATLLPDGRVLIAGGDRAIPGGNGIEPVASAELYDPKTGKFSRTGSMTTPRDSQTETLLHDGRVLISGGTSSQPEMGTQLASAELYDPKTGKFSATGSMTTPRDQHTATLLSDGRVLIAGGTDDNSAELYDPATGTFSPTGSMITGPMGGHTATLLQDGRVLVAGGYDSLETLFMAQLYDPATGTFSVTGSMTERRDGQNATLLKDGRVLMTGGDSDTELASAELYYPTTGS
jgi:hypothetical protein